MSLYVTLRPKTFDDVVGNSAMVKALKKIAKQKPADRPHAFLFSGPSGCGKTTMARILAKDFGCADIDLAEYNVANTRGIDTIREMIKDAYTSPMGGECRVFILDEAHQLSKDAQNGLLKPIEDYPKDTYFILCSTDPQKIIKTIQNRCSHFVVEELIEDDIGILVENVLDKLNTEIVSVKAFDSLVGAAEGSPRRALTILENVLSVDSEEEQLKLIQKANMEGEIIDLCRALLYEDSWSNVSEIYQSIQSNDSETIRRAVLGYMKTVLLKGGKYAIRASDIIEEMKQHTYDSGHPGLVNQLFFITER